MCVAAWCLDDLPTTPGHAAFYETTNRLPKDPPTDLDESVSQLLGSLWCNVATLVYRRRHDVPDVLNCIQVWGTCRPVHLHRAGAVDTL